MSHGVVVKFRHLGRLVTFRTLCQRFGLPYYVIWRRYRAGDRGRHLVRPVEEKFGHRGRWSENDATPAPASSRTHAVPAHSDLNLTA